LKLKTKKPSLLTKALLILKWGDRWVSRKMLISWANLLTWQQGKDRLGGYFFSYWGVGGRNLRLNITKN